MSQQFCLKWNNHTTNMLQVFESLLSTEALVDVTLACDGLSLKAHKMVLSACSPFFQSLFLENPCKHPIVIMKDMRYTDLKAIIDFMYRGEVNVSHDQLSALLKTAETLKVKGLAEVTGESRHAAGIVQQEIVNNNTPQAPPTTAVPPTLPPSAVRTDTPPLQGKRKRGRPRKRSLSDSARSDDEGGTGPKIKESHSPEIEELSGDASMEGSSDIRSGSTPSNSQSQVQAAAHSSNSVHNFNSKSHLQDHDEDQISCDDDNDFEVEPSKLMEQTLTTDNVPSNSQNSTGHITLPSVSGLEISRRSMSSTDSGSQALVPVSSIPSDSLGSNLQGPDSPQDIKPQILSFDDPPISPVAGPSHSSERSMMMYMDQGVASLPGPSNYQDSSALVPHDSQPQDFYLGKSNLYVLPDMMNPLEKDMSRRPMCPVCHKFFYDVTTLRRHMEIHDSRRQKYVCEFCSKAFCWKNHLQSHVRKVHVPKVPQQMSSGSNKVPIMSSAQVQMSDNSMSPQVPKTS
ncbi:protein tramtrack, beta isoform-like isoform X2 [Uloborus diversus]|uniref:protein tramtrack, beta isoform-like isoform X2 n=1 Tax=Uloborus diversus TaxID=327109 RepID=UPI002409DC2B|nr:protein tramtrack, beta isoform-like isoform X2 [Uloborus diversus]